MMLPYWTAPLAAALGNLFIGVSVLWSQRRERLHRVFALLTGTLVMWNLDVFSLYFFAREGDALWWSRLFRPGMFLVPAALYHFVAAFRERRSRFTTMLVVLGYLVSALFIVADAQGTMVAGVRRLHSGYWPVMAPLYNAFIGVLLLSFIVFLASLVDEFERTESPRRRVQAKFWLLGAVVALPLAAANLLPFFGIDVYPVGSLGNLVCTGICAYAIVHHRLVDTDIVISKGVAFLAGALLVVVPLSVLTGWLDQVVFGYLDHNRALLNVAILLTAAIAFPRVAGLTEQHLIQTLFREKLEDRRALAAFSHQAARSRQPEELLQQLGELISTRMAVDGAVVFLGGRGTASYAPVRSADSVTAAVLDEGHPLVAALRECEDVLVREEVVARDGAAAQGAIGLRQMAGEAAVPLRAKGGLFGFVILGRKVNGEAFSREDLELLATLGNATAIALENARLADELETSQRMVARASRLSAIGTLAAGIAHEIRNPLVAVQTFLQLLPERLQDGEFIQSFRRLSLSEINRIGALIEELLSLARSPVHAPAPCDLRALVESVVVLLEPQARRCGVQLRLVGGVNAPVSVDAGRMKQVFMNLLLNAIEASPADGTVTVALRPVGRAGGGRVCRIEVHDEGEGIPAEHRDDVFTPFFTTKDSGTGLGLAVAYQIVTEHGGEIAFAGAAAGGTVFAVTLPMDHAAETTAPAVADSLQLARG
jgi:signal transduction histidine kinase